MASTPLGATACAVRSTAVFVDMRRRLPEMSRTRNGSGMLEPNAGGRFGIPSAGRSSENRVMGDVSAVEVIEAGIADKPVVAQLSELYLHDFSVFTDDDVDAGGRFGYRYLDAYWIEPG